MVELQDVTVRAGKFLLEHVSFQVPTGAYAVLMGKTGRGKTTLLEAICGLRKVTAGQIHLRGINVTSLHPADRGVGYVPQDLALFPTLTVREHLEFSLRVRRADSAAIQTRVRELANLLALEPLLARYPLGLSGGEAQRVALGRALAFQPRVLLLDEPLSALDEETRHEMYDVLRRVQRQTGVTTLHVTHSRLEADALADRLLILENGQVVEVALKASS